MLLSIWEEDSLLRPATLSCSQQHSLSHSSHLNLPHYKNLPKSPFDICWIFSPCIFGFLIFTPFTEQWVFAISLSIFSFCILIFLHCKWQFEYLGKRWRGRMQRTSGVFLSVHLVPTLGRSSIQRDISKSKSCFMHVNRWENGRWDTGISVGTTAVCLFAYVCVCVLRTLVVLQAPELAEVVWPIWFWWLFPALSSAFHGCHAGVQLTWHKFKAVTFMFTSLRHKVYRKVFTHWHDRRWEEPN